MSKSHPVPASLPTNHSTPTLFGALLKEHREAARLTQQELAERAQVSTHSISNLERGAPHAPRRDLVSLLAAALHLSPQEEARFVDAAQKLRRPRGARGWRVSPDHPALARPATSLPAMSRAQETTDAGLLPPPAQRLIGRAALLHDLKQQMLASDHPALWALHGLPGVGKTALALALAHDPEVRQRFPDGVLWAGLGTQPNLAAILGAWAEALGIQSASLAKLPSLQAQTQAIQRALGQQQVLLVLDDAWDIEAALILKVGGPRCAHLVTTRLPNVALRLVDEGAQVVRVQELGEADGLALLARLAPEAVQLEPEEARALVRAVDGLPLALKLMGNYLRTQGYSGQPRRLRAALDLLRQGKERLHLEPVQAKAGEGAETSL
jgi:transcriptional regulator with XRE-family HTH domain